MANVQDEGNLQHKIREGYFNDPETQRLLDELHKDKALKEIKLVDGILKFKHSWMYVPQGKLRLLVLKEEHNNSIVSHRGEKPT